MTVQGPVKEQQPDGMSHGGGVHVALAGVGRRMGLRAGGGAGGAHGDTQGPLQQLCEAPLWPPAPSSVALGMGHGGRGMGARARSAGHRNQHGTGHTALCRCALSPVLRRCAPVRVLGGWIAGGCGAVGGRW